MERKDLALPPQAAPAAAALTAAAALRLSASTGRCCCARHTRTLRERGWEATRAAVKAFAWVRVQAICRGRRASDVNVAFRCCSGRQMRPAALEGLGECALTFASVAPLVT